jgi:peptidoglycan/LPS O-acetylase OafA/YrhL
MSQPTASIPRRHDLDALRAVAMLLGIALHGALAYVPLPEGGWPVRDVSHEAFAVFLASVHGFRMPLFFLISGFFTAMLYRRRGLRSLLSQRFKRIFVPLLIGTLTLVPAVWIVSIAAGIRGSLSPGPVDKPSLFTAAREGDLQQIKAELAAGAALDDPDPSLGATPLSIAALSDHRDAVALLIAGGADVNARNRDGNAPLHGAAFLGRADTVRLLLEHGADPAARNHRGEVAADAVRADWMTTQVIAGILKVQLDPDRVQAGRQEVSRLLAQATGEPAAEAQNSQPVAAAEPPTGPRDVLMLLMLFPFFHHLWFLAFLCWLVLGFAIYALLERSLGWTIPKRLVVSPARYLWLIPLTMLPQARMGLLFPAFGPDTSAGLLPIPSVLLYYSIFFFFGVAYFDCDDNAGRVGRHWPLSLPIALLVVFPVGYELTTGGFGVGDQWIGAGLRRPLSVALPVVYAWLMTLGLMGMFRSLFSQPSKTMRYMSDSSYWLYLVHLPLIILAQAMVREWQLPALAKFVLVCVATSAVLLASYQWLVRYTPIGTLLNGPRQRPARATVTDGPIVPAASG